MILSDFVTWHESIQTEMVHVNELLREDLGDEPEKLIADLEAVEVWGARVGTLLAMANSWLDRAKMALLPPRTSEKTENDRRVGMDAAVAPIRMVRDVLESLSSAIDTRISLGQSILKYYGQTADHSALSSILPKNTRII
jgi:hypothetical protein